MEGCQTPGRGGDAALKWQAEAGWADRPDPSVLGACAVSTERGAAEKAWVSSSPPLLSSFTNECIKFLLPTRHWGFKKKKKNPCSQ